jgi:hypothetical protein
MNIVSGGAYDPQNSLSSHTPTDSLRTIKHLADCTKIAVTASILHDCPFALTLRSFTYIFGLVTMDPWLSIDSRCCKDNTASIEEYTLA